MDIDVVNENDQVIGVIERERVFSARSNFRVVHIFVFNFRNELLLQKIPQGKRYGGWWGSSVAGYVVAGETYEQAAGRKLNEELGITSPLHCCGKTKLNDQSCTKFIALFTAFYSDAFKPNPDHVAELKFVDLNDALHSCESRSAQFTPTFAHLLKFFLRGDVSSR